MHKRRVFHVKNGIFRVVIWRNWRTYQRQFWDYDLGGQLKNANFWHPGLGL